MTVFLRLGTGRSRGVKSTKILGYPHPQNFFHENPEWGLNREIYTYTTKISGYTVYMSTKIFVLSIVGLKLNYTVACAEAYAVS